MDRLRSPGGCPWDAEQTHESLVEYLVEEAYETVEAIETDDDDALREELGDLLLQVVFHARIAQEHDEPWTVDDVAAGIVDKLVARHPHVFADGDATTAAQVEENWQTLKNAEKGRESVTDGVPVALPVARPRRQAAQALARPGSGARRPRGGRRGGRGGRRGRRCRAARTIARRRTATCCSPSSHAPARTASTRTSRCAPRPAATAPRSAAPRGSHLAARWRLVRRRRVARTG